MELGTRHSLGARIAWITGLRLAFLVLLLGATATLYLRGELARYPFSLWIVFLTIGAGFAAAAVYGAWLRSGKRIPSSMARSYSALILPARLKIGRYIAMSTTPTVPPMPTMSAGSMRLVSAATATSTSSS